MKNNLLQSNKERCAKCGSPFEAHHWKHYAPRTGETFHTGCFEQYKFPALLATASLQGKEEERERIDKAMNARKIDVIVNGKDWDEPGRREGNWELGYDDATFDLFEVLFRPTEKEDKR